VLEGKESFAVLSEEVIAQLRSQVISREQMVSQSSVELLHLQKISRNRRHVTLHAWTVLLDTGGVP
jgi:hypothetical protein